MSSNAWHDPGAAPRPRGWKRKRTRVLRRDGYRCTWIESKIHGGWPVDEHGPVLGNEPYDAAHEYRCTSPAQDVDHAGAKDDHSEAALRSLCRYHHRRRTAAQGHAAQAALRAEAEPKHPGLK